MEGPTPTATASQASTGQKTPRILACVLCQHRKIKCDRTFPCANCLKAKVTCTQSTPAPARKRRRPNHDLQERLARCEKLLKEYATEKDEGSALTPVHTAQISAFDDPYLRLQPHGKLVKDDGGTRFMDNFLFGTIYDELRAMREIVEADDTDDATPVTTTPDDNADLILGGESPAQTFEDLWPDATHVFPLWQMFLDRVHPLIKIIHVPTLQPYLAEATSGSHKIPKNVEVLLFSIFLMAVVSLDPEECLGLLGCSREQALQRYSSGVRLGLMRMGFLKSHDVTTLQALVIYVISLQGRYNRHAAWVLNGVVIRIAQKMGLHRDGELLGLSPFEAEMRRRVWWQIILLDAKYALMSGLGHSLLPRSWDTKEPKNVNDVDLFPTASEPFQDRDGPTEMVFSLMVNKVAKFLVRVPSLEAVILAPEPDALNQSAGPSSEACTKYRDALETLRMELEELLGRTCDPKAGPIHQMTLELKKNLMTKLDELATHPRQQPGWGTEIRSLKDNAFKMAVGSLEHSTTDNASTKSLGFLWYTKLNFQIDVCLYMVGQLQHRKAGSLVERAWKQVEEVYDYHPELYDLTNKTYSVLATLILKGWAMRQDVFHAQGEMLETPPCVEKLRFLIGDDCKAEPSPQAMQATNFTYALNEPQQPAAVNDDPAAFDQFLVGYLDATAVEWDMFGAPVNLNLQGAANGHPPLDGYGMGSGMGFGMGSGMSSGMDSAHSW